MAFSVSDFSGQINSRAVAKQHSFDSLITFPARMAIPAGGGAAISELRFRVDSAEIPGRSIQTIQNKPYNTGLTHKIGYDVTYPEVTMSIICGSDLAEKSLFTAWQSLIIGKHNTNQPYQRNMRIGYYKDYVSTVEINQYNETGSVSHSVTLVDAYPLTVNSMPLSWASEEIHRVTVQFAYLHFIENSIPASASSTAPFVNDLGQSIRNGILGFATNMALGAVNRSVNKATNGAVSIGSQGIGIRVGFGF